MAILVAVVVWPFPLLEIERREGRETARNERFSRLFPYPHYPRALFFLRFLFRRPVIHRGFVSIQIGRVIPRWHRFSWHFPKTVNTRFGINGFFPPIPRDSGLSFSMKIERNRACTRFYITGILVEDFRSIEWRKILIRYDSTNENIFWFIVSRGLNTGISVI